MAAAQRGQLPGLQLNTEGGKAWAAPGANPLHDRAPNGDEEGGHAPHLPGREERQQERRQGMQHGALDYAGSALGEGMSRQRQGFQEGASAAPVGAAGSSGGGKGGAGGLAVQQAEEKGVGKAAVTSMVRTRGLIKVVVTPYKVSPIGPATLCTHSPSSLEASFAALTCSLIPCTQVQLAIP